MFSTFSMHEITRGKMKWKFCKSGAIRIASSLRQAWSFNLLNLSWNECPVISLENLHDSWVDLFIFWFGLAVLHFWSHRAYHKLFYCLPFWRFHYLWQIRFPSKLLKSSFSSSSCCWLINNWVHTFKTFLGNLIFIKLFYNQFNSFSFPPQHNSCFSI